MDDLIDIPKSDRIGNWHEWVKGGFMIAAHTKHGSKHVFLPKDLNSDIEDKFYHGQIVGDYHG